MPKTFKFFIRIIGDFVLNITYYKDLRPNNITSPKYRHLLLLIYWIIFGIAFRLLEMWGAPNGNGFGHRDFVAIEWPAVDNAIPFCEIFLIPYLFWFIYIVGMHLYTLVRDIEGFKKYMWVIILTYTFCALVYLVFPNKQELRPADFERDNFLTRFMAGFYNFDTNTNVFPSIHVTGSLAVHFALWNDKYFSKPIWRVIFTIITTSICASTVFLKQHSILDVFPAVAISFLSYYLVYKVKLFDRFFKSK